MDPERLIPSDKRPIVALLRIVENLGIAFAKNLLPCFTDEIISKSLNVIITKSRALGITNIKEIKTKIVEFTKKELHSEINEFFNTIEQKLENLDLQLDIDFIQLIEKIHSISIELRKEILFDTKQSYGLISYLESLNQFFYAQIKTIIAEDAIILDEMEQFIIDELQKNVLYHYDSVVVVGGIHAKKISNYLDTLPEFVLLQSHGAKFDLPMSLEQLILLCLRTTCPAFSLLQSRFAQLGLPKPLEFYLANPNEEFNSLLEEKLDGLPNPLGFYLCESLESLESIYNEKLKTFMYHPPLEADQITL